MNKIIDLIKAKYNFLKIVEQPILDSSNIVVGFHCYTQNEGGKTISGGTFSDKETALRISLAELIERYFFQELCKTDLRNQYFINEYPTTCGFAAGFENRSSRFRAICEGLERWVWSQWIDHRFNLQLESLEMKYTSLTKVLLADFDEFFWYSKLFQLKISEEECLELKFIVFLGCKDDGIFAGSRVSTVNDELCEHAVVEAHRNYRNSEFYKNYPEKVDYQNMVATRLVYFSKNKVEALNQINSATKMIWPNPELLILKQLETGFDSVFIWRCLFKEYIGWHLGDEKRFVY